VQEGKHSKAVLTAIAEIEKSMQEQSVFDRVQQQLNH
jgi:hypothetical protein